MTYIDIGLIIIELIACVLLFLLAGYAEKVKNVKWKLCYLVPAVVCLLFLALAGMEISMTGAYIGAVIFMVGFFAEKKNVRRICSAVAAVPVIISLIAANNYDGYRSADYYHDFVTAMDNMERFYVLKDHKGIDFDELRAEYGKKFREVTAENDEVGNYILWQELTSEFNDSHVDYIPLKDFEDIKEEAGKRVFGNDYGLSLALLSDGTYAAVNVDDSLKSIGINNGTVITAWDDKELSELGKDKTCYYSVHFADKDNERFYRSIMGSGEGGDSITIGYIDKNGNEKTATLPELGEYYTRCTDTIEKINSGMNVGHMTWNKINSETYCLRVKTMMYDMNSAKTGNHDIMEYDLVTKVEELKTLGVKNIIIDMRDNNGGSGQMVQTLAKVFAPVGEHYYCTDGLWDYGNNCYSVDEATGKFKEGRKNYYEGMGLWDGKVVLIVNASAVSAADHTVSVFNLLDNATTMGFTESAGSAQGIAGKQLENGMVQYSASLLLDENGNVSVDSGPDMESGNDVDIIVPFDNEAITAIFDNGEDYLMDKALGYLNR